MFPGGRLDGWMEREGMGIIGNHCPIHWFLMTAIGAVLRTDFGE